MKKHEKEIEQVLLDNEKDVYNRLEGTYNQALKDVQGKYKELQESIDKLIEKESRYTNDPEQLEIIKSQIQSKIYQQNYQKALQEQLNNALDTLNSSTVNSIEDYLNAMYEDGFISQLYSLQKYGIPVLAPINHELLVKAVSYNTDNIPLSKRIYSNVEKAKRQIRDEISRGIATGMSQQDIARNISERMGVSYRKAKQIAQNEGHRVVNDAKIDSMHASKDRGADIVKVWDCTFDKKTRPIHAQLDQQHAEIDDYFEYSGGKVFAPKRFGKASLDINCRCALMSVPRWDIEDEVEKRDNITGELIKAKNYADWKEKYYNVIEDSEPKSKGQQKEALKEQHKKKLSDYKDLGNASSTDHYFNKTGTSEWINSLNDEHKAMINLYTSNYYKNINNFNRRLNEWEDYDEIIKSIEKYKDQFDSIVPLTREEGESMGAFFRRRREAQKDPVRKAKEYYDKIQELEKSNNVLSDALAKYNLKDDIKLYRAVDSNAFGGLELDDLVGTIYKDFSFMSTSPTLDSSYVNKNIIMELFIPKGTGRGAYIKDLSNFKEEREFLLEKGSAFEIKEVVKQGDKTVIRMEWLGNDG